MNLNYLLNLLIKLFNNPHLNRQSSLQVFSFYFTFYFFRYSGIIKRLLSTKKKKYYFKKMI